MAIATGKSGFSLHYQKPDAWSIEAVDWKDGRWTVAYTDDGSSWNFVNAVAQKHYEFVVIEKFLLGQWLDEIPFETFCRTSPADLMRMRREKERDHLLCRVNVCTDSVGHYPAEEYE